MDKKCIKCGTPKDSKIYGKIWLSDDGYCSVCNHQFKDRKRQIQGMDNFVKTIKIKEGKYTHLDTTGIRPSKKRKFIAESPKKAIVANYEFEQLEKKKNPKLDKWIR